MCNVTQNRASVDLIARIEASLIVVPLETPVWLGGAAVRERQYCMVRVRSEGGAEGVALGFTRNADLAGMIIHQLAPELVGQPAEHVEALWESMYRAVSLNGRQGAFMRAISLVDIALWDLKAKLAGLPLHRLLGGYRASMPVMMAGGYYRSDKGSAELCEEFLEYAGEGFTRLKLIVGGASMDEDLDRFIAVRDALPDHIALGVDSNGAWQDPKCVLKWIKRADARGASGAGLAFVEEPLPPEQRDQLAWLREHSPVPLAVGEFIAGRWTFAEYIHGGCLDRVRADATLCGGISEWRKIAALANAANLPLMPHYFASIHVHPALALPGCDMIEVVSTRGLNSSFHLLMGHAYELKAGHAYPLDAPGLGLTPDEDAIAAHTVKSLV